MNAETLLPLGKLDPGLKRPGSVLDMGVESEAQCVDRLGYHALSMEESRDDPFQVLTHAAAPTQWVNVGTSVAIAFALSPLVAAMAAWTLQKISGVRCELGLGTQVRSHRLRRYGMP
jgi:alkanesulfonate monooxygenase SsuD/methylene tetrahydromethanopterin reductase-like flavin-dependent oxidoreductase (luciferase family)